MAKELKFPWNLKPGDLVVWHEIGSLSDVTETVEVENVQYLGTKGEDGCLITIKGKDRKDLIDAFWPELVEPGEKWPPRTT